MITHGLLALALGIGDIVCAERLSRKSLRIERLFNPDRQKPSWLASEKAYRIVGVTLVCEGTITLLVGLLV